MLDHRYQDPVIKWLFPMRTSWSQNSCHLIMFLMLQEILNTYKIYRASLHWSSVWAGNLISADFSKAPNCKIRQKQINTLKVILDVSVGARLSSHPKGFLPLVPQKLRIKIKNKNKNKHGHNQIYSVFDNVQKATAGIPQVHCLYTWQKSFKLLYNCMGLIN